MKFSISKNLIQDALQNLSKATPTRSTIPILSSVLFTIENGLLILRTTDLEITMLYTLDAKIEESGSVAIDHRTLMDIANAMPETEIEISVKENFKVSIQTDFGSYDVVGSNPDEFPKLPEVDNKKEVIIQSQTLNRLIEKTLFALSRDELKPALTGVLLEVGEEQISAISTDGHRLVVCSRTDYKSSRYIGEVIIPRKFLTLLPQYLYQQDEITLWIGDSHLTVSFEKMTIFSRIIDERYPDYRSVIPKDNDKIAKLDREEFLGSVKRVAIFSNKSTRQVTLHLSKNNGVLTTEDPESSSSAREEFPIEYSGEDLVIGYNANYLKDMLSHLDTEKIFMELKTPISAGLILPEKQDEHEEITMLIMPMRTSG